MAKDQVSQDEILLKKFIEGQGWSLRYVVELAHVLLDKKRLQGLRRTNQH